MVLLKEEVNPNWGGLVITEKLSFAAFSIAWLCSCQVPFENSRLSQALAFCHGVSTCVLQGALPVEKIPSNFAGPLGDLWVSGIAPDSR
jgi:hypothetical protein